jgi:PIN domain
LTGFTLDTGALIALERGNQRVTALIDRAAASPDALINLPAAVLGQAFRNGARQVRLTRLLANPQTNVVPLDEESARVVGMLLGLRGCSDVVDASVVVCARQYRQPVLTSDPRDLLALDPALSLGII